jgi:hypothetical protein
LAGGLDQDVEFAQLQTREEVTDIGICCRLRRAFTIYLPRAHPDHPAPESASATVRDYVLRSHATVLLIEDEQPLRSVSQRVLEREGYTVLAAEDGFEGLAIAETFSGTIDLLITDVVLPGLDGREVAARLKQRRPALKVLYMTGYTDDEVLRRGLINDKVSLLDKPFNGAQLADAAYRAIQRPETRDAASR